METLIITILMTPHLLYQGSLSETAKAIWSSELHTKSSRHLNLHGCIDDKNRLLRASRSEPNYPSRYSSVHKPEKWRLKPFYRSETSVVACDFVFTVADKIRKAPGELLRMCQMERQTPKSSGAAERSSIVMLESWDSTSTSEILSTDRLNLHGDAGEDNIGNGGNNSNEQFPVEKLKTLVAVLYMMFGFVVSVVTLQFVHDRVPSMTEDPPLPDIFFDIVPRRIEGAFSYCESIGMVLTSFTILVAIFHKHRFIIMRRIFFILGTLYLYRSITIYVTTLPVPGLHFKCAPKANGHISLMLTRAASLLFGGGLSVTGSHHLCGDYLFSGHTIILVITYMTIHEYTPKRWWFLHWLCWVMSATGIVCILLAHDHYTIDVVVAYLLTTRLFWSYHTLCNVSVLKEYANSNLLSRAWWFPIFRYFEENVASTGCLPRQFEWPLPWPRRFRNNIAPGRRSPIKGV
ncbi:phosphatidylcholine:ceramide cholinephosphotransferase 2 isoform X1 [Ciona intestinalis]